MSKEIKFLPEYYNNQYSNRINVSDLYYLDKDLNKNLESHIYSELVAFDGYFYRSGWKQETQLDSGDVYSIGANYSSTNGQAWDHYHHFNGIYTPDYDTAWYWRPNTGTIGGNDKYIEGKIYGYNFYNPVKLSSYSGSEGHGWIITTDYTTASTYGFLSHKYHKKNGVKKNKVYIYKEVNYYEYIGGNFFQDPYTLEYYGEPDEDYFKYTNTTLQEFQDNINKEIKKFSVNKDSYNIELRREIGYIRYQLKLCSLNIIPPNNNNTNNYDFKKEMILLKQDLNKWMSVNKYYVIEHSTKWRNDFNFSPNKEFLPELEYADVGGHQSSDFTYFSNFFIKENSN